VHGRDPFLVADLVSDGVDDHVSDCASTLSVIAAFACGAEKRVALFHLVKKCWELCDRDDAPAPVMMLSRTDEALHELE
jgi:hypothetical protein